MIVPVNLKDILRFYGHIFGLNRTEDLSTGIMEFLLSHALFEVSMLKFTIKRSGTAVKSIVLLALILT